MSEGLDPRQVPMRSIDALLQLVGGVTIQATLYLSLTSPAHDGPETLDEFLDAVRRFLPVRTAEGNGLVARDAIVTVRVSSAAPKESLATTAPAAIDMIRVVLDGGAAIDGVLLHEAATGDRSRLSDFFNRESDFFALEDERGVVHVSKRRVASITF